MSKIKKTKLWTSNGFYENTIQCSIKMHESRTNLIFACTFTLKNRIKDLLDWGTSLRISVFDCPFDFLFALEEISNGQHKNKLTEILRYPLAFLIHGLAHRSL